MHMPAKSLHRAASLVVTVALAMSALVATGTRASADPLPSGIPGTGVTSFNDAVGPLRNSENAWNVIATPNGSLYFTNGDYASKAYPKSSVGRLNADGIIDQDFDSNVFTLLADESLTASSVQCMTVDSSGRVVLQVSGADGWLRRTSSAGSADTAFNSAIVTTASTSAWGDYPGTCVFFQTDSSDNIYLGGGTNGVPMYKVSTTGVVQSTYATTLAATLVAAQGASYYIEAFQVRPDGSAVVVVRGSSVSTLIVDSSGALVKAFPNSDGLNVASWYGISTADSSGNVYLASNYYDGVVRKINYSTDTVDTDYTTAVIAADVASDLYLSSNVYPGDLAVDPSGVLYVTDSYNRKILKFNADGTFDAAASAALVSAPGAPPGALAVMPGGDIVVSGLRAVQGTGRWVNGGGFVRFESDGPIPPQTGRTQTMPARLCTQNSRRCLSSVMAASWLVPMMARS